MTCGDKLWSFRKSFCHSDRVLFDGTQRLTASSAPFVIQRRRADDMRKQIMVISHTFSPFRHSCVRWHPETNVVFYTLLSSRGGGPDDIQRQIMVISHTISPFRHSCVRWHAQTNVIFYTLLSSRGGGPDDIWRQIMVIPHTFSPFRHSHVRWHVETNVVFCAF